MKFRGYCGCHEHAGPQRTHETTAHSVLVRNEKGTVLSPFPMGSSSSFPSTPQTYSGRPPLACRPLRPSPIKLSLTFPHQTRTLSCHPGTPLTAPCRARPAWVRGRAPVSWSFWSLTFCIYRWVSNRFHLGAGFCSRLLIGSLWASGKSPGWVSN